MLLLPWNEQQVRSYLSHALPEMDSDALLAMLGAVHNLTELSQRPYTLRLLTEHIPAIERLRAQAAAHHQQAQGARAPDKTL